MKRKGRQPDQKAKCLGSLEEDVSFVEDTYLGEDLESTKEVDGAEVQPISDFPEEGRESDPSSNRDSFELTPYELGRRGERAAVRFLEAKDYEILDVNWACFAGEADIVCLDGDTLCFVEVKTRRGTTTGFPEEAITSRKRARYEKIAGCYLKEHDFIDLRVRFDVISIMVIAENRAFLRMHINAFGDGSLG